MKTGTVCRLFSIQAALLCVMTLSYTGCSPSAGTSGAGSGGVNSGPITPRLVRIDGTVKNASGERLERFTIKVRKDEEAATQVISTDIRGQFSVTLRLGRSAIVYFTDRQGRQVKWKYDSAGGEPSVNLVADNDTFVLH